MASKEILFRFITCISARDVEGLYGLMADDHVFVDNVGNKYKGKDMMREGWKAYYAMFPDYKIEVDIIMQEGNIFLLCGSASGSYKGNREAFFKIPAAWKAGIENGKVKLWQVFADTKAQFDVMDKNNSGLE